MSSFFLFCFVIGDCQIPAYFIDTEGDTTEILLDNNTYNTSLFKVIPVQEKPKYKVGDNFEILNLERIEELGFVYKEENHIYHTLILKDKLILRKLEVDGYVKLYSEINHLYNGLRSNQFKYIIKRGVSTPFYVNEGRIRKQLLNELEICSDFYSVLKHNKYTIKDLKFLIESYNLECY